VLCVRPCHLTAAARTLSGMEFRVATADDVVAVTETIRLAFAHDPVWGPALAVPGGSTEHLDPFWRIYVEGGMRFGTVFVTGDPGGIVQSTAVWTPPGEPELSEAQETQITELINETFPAELAAGLFELYDRFDAAHPHDPHAYLGLLATHPEYRGNGIAQQLLAANLADWDAMGVAAYLESTNPANLHRYARAGFEPRGEFNSVLDDAPITTMWRPAKS
jgi:ribosomal protein S18 acetylase RimI-like enzyme